ncbi:MAG: HK97 gp10 family phage protein [Clostridiaceae bacterium]|nr:HK97 gp10 family phage protein [Clostridiaceae bacterium]
MPVIDTREFSYLYQSLHKIHYKMHGETKKFMRQEGDKLKRRTAREARKRVKKTAVERPQYKREAGQYHKSIKRGKVVYQKDGQAHVRVYSSDRIAHLVENGWTPKSRSGKRGKKKGGRNVFDQAAKNFEQEFEMDCGMFVDRMLRDFDD